MMNTQPKLLSREQRRRLVLGAYMGYVGVVILWSISTALSSGWFFAAALAVGALMVYCYTRLLFKGGFWLLANAPDAQLDERQRYARDNAYRLAYAYASSAVMLALLYWYFASDIQKVKLWLPSTENELLATFWGFWLLLTTLPSAVLAWIEPDPITD